VSYDLNRLGWKAFQYLACAVAAEVLQRPVQTFLGSRDGGRDAAFTGTWEAADGTSFKSTIQCKFLGTPGATLTLAGLKDELPKAKELARQNLAEDYVILTNAGVSGDTERRICAAFEKVGVRRCRVFGGSWIEQQLQERVRLRMMVPRVYGIGDLSHIVTGHGYKQAKAILDSMGSDLGCFVPTDAYKQSLSALNKHGFVILLGDPASGKSTIAAILALGALDDGCVGAIKINSPDELHLWHPGEKQFLWVDDAFGPNQFDVSRMSRWNAQLGALRAAIEGGARVVFTSRNYIWEAARPHLKSSSFPLFRESQVIVNVYELSSAERAQMLYNHVRRVQPRDMRKRLKPFLAAVSSNEAFLPETARRLGDPIFTSKIELSADRLQRLVEAPVEFLTEILEQLDDASRAAVALIFLSPEEGVPSPITASPALDMVTRLLGVQSAEIARALQHLNDSLTRLLPHDDGDRWIFRHPTVTDAFAEIAAGSPELVELYVSGAKIDRLIREVVCGPTKIERARLRVPVSLYPPLIGRLLSTPLDEALKSFLGSRCEKRFLSAMMEERPEILEWAAGVYSTDISVGSKVLLAALSSFGLLPEAVRARLVKQITRNSIEWLDSRPLEDNVIRQMFKPEEFDELVQEFRHEWLTSIPNLFQIVRGRFHSDDELTLYEEFKENLERAERFYADPTISNELTDAYRELDAYIFELNARRGAPLRSERSSIPLDMSSAECDPSGDAAIFDDVDG
jgi:hypothetical protein